MRCKKSFFLKITRYYTTKMGYDDLGLASIFSKLRDRL
jgi:hypothetical protein